MITKRPLLLLLFILLLAFGLRIFNIDTFGFWTDEGLTPLRSGYSLGEILSNRITIQQGVGRDTHPPLYYLLIHFTQKGFGQTDFAYRYPSLLASLLLIPVIYQLGRRLHSLQAGLLAAFLTAVNPLQVYYSNEARMYTFFVLLAAIMTYLLWRALSGGELRRYLLLYLLVAGLTIYTHYTAAFLIAVQSLFWLWLLWQKGQQKLIIGMVVVGVLAAIPLVPYTIPRLFTGPEANYFYISPGVMVQDAVHAFVLGKTMGNPWGWPAVIFNTTTLLLIGFALWSLRGQRQKMVLLLSYMLSIVFGLMVGSLLKPMYQGVRHSMGGSPAILLLLALGFLWVWRRLAERRGEKNGDRYLIPIVSSLLFLLLIAGPVASLNNFYNNPEYIKDDYRSMIAYIEQQAGDNDVLIYNDAVLLPLHEHYRTRPDLAVTALPIYPHRAGTNVAESLTILVDSYERIWFMADPPNDKRDDEQKVLGWLESELQLFDKRWFSARTTEIITLGYSTAEAEMDELPANGRSLEQSWPQFPQLAGIERTIYLPVSQPALWFDLFWRGALDNPEATLRFSLRGPDDEIWLLQEKLLHAIDEAWPTTEQIIRRSYHLSLPAGFPPGDYTLAVQPLDRENGSPVAESTPLLEMPIAATSVWPFVVERPFYNPPALTFANGLNLRQLDLLDNEVRPGHNLPFNVYWESTAASLAPDDLRYILEIVANDGTVIREQSDRLAASWLDSLPSDTVVQQRSGIYIRPEVAPGTYRLRWQLKEGEETIAGRSTLLPWLRESVWLGEVEVVPWPLETTLPPIANPRPATFSDIIQLHGYDLTDLTDEALDLTLYWETTAVPSDNYLLFAHLISVTTGEIVSQKDVVPVSGLRPTKGWRLGEILIDNHQLSLPADLPSGGYYLNVGFYNPDTFERLPVLVETAPQPHNQLQLTTINLP